MRFSGVNVLLSFLLLAGIIGRCAAQEFQVPVTYEQNPTKPNNTLPGRLELRRNGDLLELWVFDNPKVFKAGRFTLEQTHQRISRKDRRAAARHSTDSTYALVQDPDNDFASKYPSKSAYQRGQNNLMKGNKPDKFLASQWIHIGSFHAPGVPPENVVLRFRRFLHKPVTYGVSMLPGAIAGHLPALDLWNCVPALERYFNLRKLQGYGIDALGYTRYRPMERQVIRKDFELYFEKGKSVPDPAGLQEIIDYLSRNQLVILKAEMMGAASVEGDSIVNRRLQIRRAHVVQVALQRYCDDPINKDTVILSDSWKLFRETLKGTEFAWLDSLPDSSIKTALSRDHSLMERLEPVLSLHRKAVLKLVLTKSLTAEEKNVKLQAEVEKLAMDVVNSRTQRISPPHQARLMGLLEVLLNQEGSGRIKSDRVGEILQASTSREGYLHVLMGYQAMRSFYATGKWTPMYQAHFDEGNNRLIELAGVERNGQLKGIFLRMLVDYQNFEARQVAEGRMDVNRLCVVRYPEAKEFLGLILTQHALAQLIADQREEPLDCGAQKVTSSSSTRNDTIAVTDDWLQKVRAELGISEMVQIGDRRQRKPTYDESPKGAYYFMLKKYYLGKDPTVLNWLESGDGSAAQWSAFNLFHLLSVTLENWRPFDNHFYDKEVRVPEMARLVARLKKSGGGICTPQLNSLLLMWHLKVLYYLQQFAEPGNVLHRQLAEGSLEFIADYYASRAGKMDPELTLHVVYQLNAFADLPAARHGARFGFEVLSAVAKRRVLTTRELSLFADYLRIFDPGLGAPLPPLCEEEQIRQLWVSRMSLP